MEKENLLINRLVTYSDNKRIPLHMPGHKGNAEFPNPYSIDITEIDGFDNLHYPEGILKESMEWASSIYDSKKTYYLVNGSTVGILSSIFSTTEKGDSILISRNCHKSVYHGVILNELEVEYVYPQIIQKLGIQGGILPEDVENQLKSNDKIKAVLIVSPTYEGIVSDIKAIASITHAYGIPLIVDEAHGAHFLYSEHYPKTALELGADLVIQSVHKTMSALTQTALLHVSNRFNQIEKLEQYLSMLQTSSPSYVLMASLENSIYSMNMLGNNKMDAFYKNLCVYESKIETINVFHGLRNSYIGNFGVYDIDKTKLLISHRGYKSKSGLLIEQLRKIYKIEMEMSGMDYVLGILTPYDKSCELDMVFNALNELSKEYIAFDEALPHIESRRANSVLKLSEGFKEKKKRIRIEESKGCIAGEFVYLYPPGIPILAPGEYIEESVLEMIKEYKKKGYSIQGLSDKKTQTIEIVKR